MANNDFPDSGVRSEILTATATAAATATAGPRLRLCGAAVVMIDVVAVAERVLVNATCYVVISVFSFTMLTLESKIKRENLDHREIKKMKLLEKQLFYLSRAESKPIFI